MPSENKTRKYPPDSAGRLLTANVPVISEEMGVAEIEKLLIRQSARFDTINYIYILDQEQRLSGVVSVKEVFRSPKSTLAKDLSPAKIIAAHAYTDKERIAQLALKHGLKSIPILSRGGLFLGAVPSDTILRVLHEEYTEDLLRLGGVLASSPNDDIFKISCLTSLKHRLPWLVLGLGGGLLAAGVVSGFEEVLSAHIILAAFIPLIVYMSGAISAQLQTFIIRDLAIHPDLSFSKYLLKQASIIAMISLIVSVLLYGASLALYQLPRISLVLAAAIFFANVTTLFTGLVLPFLFAKMRFDPANISGPIATIIQDILSIFTYFAVASLIL
jgi:magnesium transporter